MVNKRINILFDELVPLEGKADTVAGEIIRAICRINYRYFNDGDQIGIDYGIETCNPPAKYLYKNLDYKGKEILDKLWGQEDEIYYRTLLNELKEYIVDYLEQHPELKEQKNTEDMWSCE